MRIGMVLDSGFPPDPRVENEALSLIEAGFEVHLLCLNYGEGAPYEVYKNIHLHRTAAYRGLVRSLRALINTIPLYDILFQKRIEHFAAGHGIGVLHIHDLYLIGAALRANRKLRLPLVADLHENYVEGLKHYRFSTTFPGNLLISIPRWERTERKWVHAVDRVIVVIEEAAQRLQALGVPEDRITVVANYVDTGRFLSYGIDRTIVDRFKGASVISYLGGFDLHRGLESTIKAMPAVVQHAHDVKLVLVGEGGNSHALKQLARELGIDAHVCFEGWQDFRTFPSYIAASDICLIPHLKNVHTDNTIPHKLFHYMLMGKPVVASDCNPLRRIVETTQCGLVFESNNSEQLALKVIELLDHSGMSERLGQHGRGAVLKTYNWDASASELIGMYRLLGACM